MRTRIYAAVPLATWARLRDTVAARGARRRHGSTSAASRDSSTARSARTPRAMLEPFNDAPDDSGLFVDAGRRPLRAGPPAADKAGLQVMVHAIGDRAIRTQLDIFERVAKENGPRDRRFRIEHAQHLAPPDIPRFAAARRDRRACSRITRSTTAAGPTRSSAPSASRWTYAFRSLLDAKARLAFGCDWFVAPADAARRDLRRGDAPHARRQAPRRLGARGEDLGGGRAARVHRSTARTPSSARRRRVRSKPGSSRTSWCSSAIGRRSIR